MVIRALLAVFILLLTVSGRAQTSTAPPRTVEDILALLDQYRPDPIAVQELIDSANAEPPRVNSLSDFSERQKLAVFFHKRSRARGLIGKAEQQIADLRKALEYVGTGATQEEFEGIGDKGYILHDLAIAEVSGGNWLRALDAWQSQIQLLGSGRGRTIWTWTAIANIHAAAGDMQSARMAMDNAESMYAKTRTWQSYPIFEHNWKLAIEQGRGDLLRWEGNYVEAERRYRRAIEESKLEYDANTLRRGYRKDDVPIGLVMASWARSEAGLSRTLRGQGRLPEAEFHARASLVRTLQISGRYAPFAASATVELGAIIFESGRFPEAAALARAAIESYEKAGVASESMALAGARQALGASLAAQEHWSEAIAIFDARDQALAIDPAQYKRFGSDDSFWGIALLRTGQHKKALVMLESLYRKRLTRPLAATDYFSAESRGFYAMALAADGQADKALIEFQSAVPVLLEEARRNVGGRNAGATARQMRLRWIFEAYMKLLVDLRDSPLLKTPEFDAGAEAFRIADAARGSVVQWALAESAARATPSDPVLANLARREQDAQQRFVTLSDLLNRLLSAPPDQQLPRILAALHQDIDAIRVERDKLKLDLDKRFPDYAELISPKPTTVSQTQAALAGDESLISIYVGADRSYVWAVPKYGKVAFAEVALTDAEVGRQVAQLRRALDAGEMELTGVPRFDLAQSHELYRQLLQPVETGWRDAKSLIVVPHKALGQLPFAVLTTAPFLPDATAANAGLFAEYRQAPWLIRRAAIARLPSVSTLLALRRMPQARPGRKEFVGFGDPLFSKQMALAANDASATRRRFRNLGINTVAAAPMSSMANAPVALPEVLVTNSAMLAQLSRLPDTALEITSIARALNADTSTDVFLGSAASEKNVKFGQLDNRRVVVFATHGLVPGDLNGLTQPALALSAPEVTGNVGEDGLLTMEEVLGLKLNADWVVLSACNTASGNGAGSEAVSGLGKAFFYAGARSLLVSNWPVETVSARLLTTRLFEQQVSGLSRAESLRRTMIELIDQGQSPGDSGQYYLYAHPMFWAPFTLVGEGGQ